MNIGGERYVYPSLNYEHKLHCPNPNYCCVPLLMFLRKFEK